MVALLEYLAYLIEILLALAVHVHLTGNIIHLICTSWVPWSSALSYQLTLKLGYLDN